MKAKPKRPPGRPPAPEAERRGENLTLRVRADLKEALERHAGRTGRSLSAEAEAWLGQALLSDGSLDQALDLAFGGRSTALILAIGRLMRDTSILADLASGRMPDSSGGWLADPFAFQQVRAAIDRTFDALRPEGEVIVPRPTFLNVVVVGDAIPQAVSSYYEHIGKALANSLLSAIVDRGVTSDLQALGEKIHQRLGPDLVKRIKSRGVRPDRGR